MKILLKFVQRLAPWAIAALIFIWLFRSYSIISIVSAAKQANFIAFFGFAILYFVTIFLLDTAIFARVLTRFHHPIRFKELLPARAVTYLLMILNYGASQAAFAYYLKRTKKVAISEVLGLFALIALIDLYWLIGFAVTGSFYQDFVIKGISLAPTIQTVGAVATVGLVLHLVFWRYYSHKPWKFTQWLRDKRLFRIFHEATLKDYAVIAVMRSPIHICIIASMYIILLTFHAHAPLSTIFSATPIAFLLGVLPISPSGLGVTNGALVELLGPYVTSPLIDSGAIAAPAIILAASLLWMFSNLFLKGLLGFVFLSRVSKDLFKVPEDANEAPPIHPVT